jgi:hypothetical protein
MYALASLVKNNQARPMRRMVRWYKMEVNRLASRQDPSALDS